MPRAYDRQQLPVDRDPLKQLDTNYGKLPKFAMPFTPEFLRDAFRNTLKQTLGIDFNDDKPFLTWLQERPFWTDLLQRLDAARLLAQARIRAGTNLVSDPDVDYPEFWDQYATEQVDDTEVTPYSGSHALKLTSLGDSPVYAFFNTDSDGGVDPIKVRRGDMFIVEARAYAPTSNNTGDVQLIGRVRNSRTEATQDIVIDYVQMSGAYRGQWQKLSGMVEIPAGFDQFSAGLLLPAGETTADQPFYGGQFVIREITDTNRLFAISSLLARRGSNLLLDPSVEDPVFWAQGASEQVGTDVVVPSSGSTALQVTSRGGTATDVFFNTAFNGAVEPITVRFGEVFAVEARVLSPATNTSGNLQLIATFENSRSGASTTEVLEAVVFDDATKGSWQPMVGYARVPLGYNRLSVGLRIPAGQIGEGQSVYADELVLHETTAVKRIYDVIRLRSRRGGNLVTDSNIEDAAFWTQPSTMQVGTDVVTPSSGEFALQVTSQGSTGTDVFFNAGFDGSIDPITARLGEYYAVEARVFSPSTNTTGDVSLIARLENSRTGAASDVVITTKTFDSPNRNAWQKMSGYVKVPAGYNRISLGLRLPAGQTTAGQHFFADELAIHEATATQRLKEINRLRIRRGSNLVTDPTFDDPDFWTQESTAIVDYQTVVPHGGNQSLQVTSRGATATPVYFTTADDGSIAPVKVRRNETYEIAAYVYSPAANANGVVSLTAHLSNSRSGATSDVTVKTFTFTSTYENQWVLVNGFVRIPAGFNQLAAGVLLDAGDTTAGNVFFVSEVLLRESTAAKRLFDLSRQRVRHGVNLLPDANFDDSDFWVQESAAQVEAVTVGSTTVTPRTGNYSLQITSRGQTPTTVWFNAAYDGSVEPIKARLNERYFLECYALSPASNSAATMKLIARLGNARTGETEDVVVDTQAFDTLTEDEWQRLSGYVRIPAGRNLISAGVMLDAGASVAGNQFFVDDALLKEMTGAQRITDVLFDGFTGTRGAFGKDPDEVLDAMDGIDDGKRALRLARQRAKVGPNFVNDPRVEDTSYWSGQGANVARSEAYSRNGGSSLQVTCGPSGSTAAWWNVIDGGTVQPIVTWEGDALYAQCWYFAPAQPGGGTVELVVKAINSHTGASIETVLKTATVAEAGQWKKLSGTYVMPEGADSFSAGVKVSATGLEESQTYRVYFDALVIKEQTGVQRLFNLLKLRIRSGNNLLTDPNFDDAEFWTQTSIGQVGTVTVGSETITPRTGNHSLQVTSQGATATDVWFNTAFDGSVEPIKARVAERYYVETYVYSPAANSPATVHLVARLSHARTGDSTDVTVMIKGISSLNESQWLKLSGFVKIPAGYNQISVGVKLPAGQSTAGDVLLFDDALVREMTAAQKLFDLTRLRLRMGSNLLTDPNFDDSDFWVQESAAQVEAVTVGSTTVTPRTGAYSLQVTSQGATATEVWFNTAYDGTVEPIKTRFSDWYYVETYCLSPQSNDDLTVQLVARLGNARSGATTDVVMATKTFTSATEDQWQKISGYVKIPAGYNQLSVGVKLPAGQSTAGNPAFFDDALIRETTFSQRLFDLTKMRLGIGTNLVSDPNFDSADFWVQPSIEQVGTKTVGSTSVVPRTGNFNLQVTSRGATATEVWFNTAYDGTVEPIKVRPGELHYVEVFCMSPALNADATVKLVARLTNRRSGDTTDVVIATQTFNALNEGLWQKISGYVKVPLGYNYLSAGIVLPANMSTAGDVLFFDDALIRESTAVQRLADNLFDGFNGSTGSFGKDPDDVFGAMDGVRDGTAALRFARQRAKAGPNFVNDPRIEEFGYWTQPSTVRSDDYRRNGKYSLKITSQGATPTYCWWTTIDGGIVQPLATWEDDCIHAQCWVYAPVQTGSGTIKLVARASNSYNGGYTDTVINTLTITEDSWTKISGVYTVPQGADSLTVGVLIDANAAPTGYTVYLDSLSIREATAAQKLTDKIHQALTGENGTGKTDADVDTGLRAVFAKLFDGLSGNPEGTNTSKSGFSLFAAAKATRDRVDAAQTTAEDAGNTALEIIDSGSNLITNSDFENGLVSPQPTVATYSEDQAFSGTRSLKMVAGGSTKTFYLLSKGVAPRTIPVSPDTVYLFEAQIYVSGFSGSSVIDGLRLLIEPIARDGTALPDTYAGTTISTALNDVWTKVSKYVTLPAADTVTPRKSVAKMKVGVQLQSTVTNGTVHIDQVSLREVTVAKAAQTAADTADGKAVVAQNNLQTVVDGVVQAVDGGGATGAGHATTKTKLQTAFARIFDGLSKNPAGTTASATAADMHTAAYAARGQADTGVLNASTADGKAVVAQNNLQTVVDGVVQAVDGGSDTGAAHATTKTKLQTAFARIFDGLSKNASGTTSAATAANMYTAAYATRGQADTGVLNAGTADGKAVTADTKAQNTIDAVIQAIDGSNTTNASHTTAKTKLQSVWNNLWDGLNGTSLTGSPGTLYSSTTYTQSSVYSGLNAATYQYMNNDSATPTNNQTGTNGDSPSFIKADVGSTQYINHIVIGYDYTGTLPGGWDTTYTAGATIEGSTNNSSWTTIGTVPTYASTGSTNGLASINIGGNYRYIRLTKSGYLCLLEFQVWVGGSVGGSSPATGKLPADVQVVAAAVKNTTTEALTSANTADGKAVVADSKAVLADVQASLGSAANNLVISPDFEDDTIPRYVYNSGVTQYGTVAYSPANPLTGTKSLLLTRTSSAGSAYVKLANNRDGDTEEFGGGKQNWSQCRQGDKFYLDCNVYPSHYFDGSTSGVLFNFAGKNGNTVSSMEGGSLVWGNLAANTWHRLRDIYTVTQSQYTALLPVIGFISPTVNSYMYIDSFILRLATLYETQLTQTLTTRSTGLGQNIMGVKLTSPTMIDLIIYRCGTADASGSSTFELKCNGSAVSGTSKTIAAASQISGGSVTGKWYFNAGDVLTVNCTAVGTTPGSGLVASISGALLA